MPSNKLVKKIDTLKYQYSGERTKQKTDLLTTALNMDLALLDDLSAYHDLLLFIKAYPDNEENKKLSFDNLEKLATYIARYPLAKNVITLTNTGIANTSIEAAYNFDILRNLVNTHGFFLDFDSFGADQEELFNVFSLIVNSIEQIAFADEDFDINKWLEYSFSKDPKQKLYQIVQLINNGVDNEKIKTDLFSRLQIFIKATLNEKFSRTFIDINHATYIPFFHNETGIQKEIDFLELINRPISSYLSITREEKESILYLAQIQLFSLLREIDAITYADHNNIEFIILERGFSIALFYQKIHKRNALESVIGMMAFKNGVPYSYGAFWILGNTARIAFNIFETFRGGESALLFAQIVRILRMHFNIHQIIIEPYQIGKNNEEAIQSGAFWFYYKLGFKSCDIKLQSLAEKEFLKIKNNKNYRSSATILEKLSNSSIEMEIAPIPTKNVSAIEISKYISRLIQYKFNGKRIELENETIKVLLDVLEIRILSNIPSLSQTESFKRTSLIYYGIAEEIKLWTKEEKNDLVEIMISKLDNNERDYILKFQNHNKLNNALVKMVNSVPYNN